MGTASDPASVQVPQHLVSARRRRRPPLTIIFSFGMLLFVAVCAVFPGLVAGLDPARIQPTVGLTPPSGEYWLGTDQLGRDVFSRVVYGTRGAVMGPLIIALATVVLATVLGLLAGYRGGWVDTAVGRTVDILYALPPLLVAIIVVGVLGGGYALAILVLTILGIPTYVRILRAAVMERRHLGYVEAAETLGVRPLGVMVKHLLPNLVPVIVAAFFLRFTYAIVDMAALSFLGLGTPPGSADWGRMVAENRAFILINPWASIAPGLALMLLALSANFVGDWVYERFEKKARTR